MGYIVDNNGLLLGITNYKFDEVVLEFYNIDSDDDNHFFDSAIKYVVRIHDDDFL